MHKGKSSKSDVKKDVKIDVEALKGHGEALKGDEEASKSANSDWTAIKGDGEVMGRCLMAIVRNWMSTEKHYRSMGKALKGISEAL